MGSESRSFTIGWLIIRIGIGLLLMCHGIPKLAGGPALWGGLGGKMELLGIEHFHTFFGFMAAFSEAVGGLCIALGVLTRPMAILCAFTMFVAVVFKCSMLSLDPDDGLIQSMGNLSKGIGYPFALLMVFLGIAFIGGGAYALGQQLFGRRWFA